MSKARKPQNEIRAARRSNVAGYSYHVTNQTLDVTFYNGRTYRYSGIHPIKASAFGDSQSRGGYLHQHIIGQHEGVEIFPDQDAQRD